jgi:hypothetical protein
MFYNLTVIDDSVELTGQDSRQQQIIINVIIGYVFIAIDIITFTCIVFVI